MQRHCVFTSAGDRNAVRHWLPPGGDRTFDLLVAFYGDDDTRFAELREVATRAWRIKGGKMQNLHALVQAGEIDLSAYSHVWVPDDDVQIDPADIPRLFALAAAYDLWVSQPAFVAASRVSWPVTRVAETRNQIRLTSFVEVTCPLFRRDKLETFLAAYDGSLVGWGIDWWFAHELGAAWSGRFAVMDAITACNPQTGTKPGRFREIDRLQPPEERRAAWIALREARGIRMAKAETLATLPLPPGWRASGPAAPAATAKPPQKPVFGRLAMTSAEAEAFRTALARPLDCYLEWGLGGSTRAALQSTARRIISVESDQAWIAEAKADPEVQAAEAGGRLTILHGDVGPTGPWGRPKGGNAASWAPYIDTPLEALRAEGAWPGLVLVDGRFRVACALAIAWEVARRPDLTPPAMLLHDVGPERPHYGPIFEAWETEASTGTLHLLRLRPGLEAAPLERQVATFMGDVR
ncbi:hypothetical protein AAFN86_18255 [Roseomonas sp. CAU 1739]|uniref:hypothetical protein n=1 Tax=Roseomonas sp. CAU 1739 TaxID=3140364 RepID=UPI00325B9D55